MDRNSYHSGSFFEENSKRDLQFEALNSTSPDLIIENVTQCINVTNLFRLNFTFELKLRLTPSEFEDYIKSLARTMLVEETIIICSISSVSIPPSLQGGIAIPVAVGVSISNAVGIGVGVPIGIVILNCYRANQFRSLSSSYSSSFMFDRSINQTNNTIVMERDLSEEEKELYYSGLLKNYEPLRKDVHYIGEHGKICEMLEQTKGLLDSETHYNQLMKVSGVDMIVLEDGTQNIEKESILVFSKQFISSEYLHNIRRQKQRNV